MDFKPFLKSALAIGLLSFGTSFVVAYSCAGILLNKVVAILFGILLIAVAGYYVFVLIKMTKELKSRILYGVVIGFTALSMILTFVQSAQGVERMTKSTRLVYALFISLGLYLPISIQWQFFIQKFMTTFMSPYKIDTFAQNLYFMANVVINALILSVLMGISDFDNKTNITATLCIRALFQVFISFIVGGAFGVIIESNTKIASYEVVE